MRYYIGRLIISDQVSRREHEATVRIAAADEAQARTLLDGYASGWGWSKGEKEATGGWRFNEEGGIVVVLPHTVHEVSPVTFDEMAELLPTCGPVAKASVDSGNLAESVKTIARRIGDQLNKRGFKVTNSKLLDAVSAALGASQWAVVKSRVTGSLPMPERSDLPKGNPYKGPLRDAKTIEFAARVDALWLADGDVALAARLLRTTGESLLESFDNGGDADTAFCGRSPCWLPEHSLSRDFGIQSDLESLGYRIVVEHKYPGCAQVTARDDQGNELAVYNNHVSGRWFATSAMSLVGQDFTETRRAQACQVEAMRRVLSLRHAGY